MIKNSKEHLAEAGKEYWPHFKFAMYYGWLMIYGGLLSIIHGIVPGWKTGDADQIARVISIAVNRLDEFREKNGLPKRELDAKWRDKIK